MSKEKPLLEELLAEFDKFIKKWCPSWKHLIDCDENDGQRYRERLEDTFERIKEEGRREGRRELAEAVKDDVSSLTNKVIQNRLNSLKSKK